MTLRILIVKLIVIAFLGCAKKQNNKMKTIKVTGEAYNVKAGAIVSSIENETSYYIDGLKFWDDEFIGEKVVVTGELRVLDNEGIEVKNKEGEWKQTIKSTTTKNIIFNAKWQLVETKNTGDQ